jgi:hypothetical protein
MRIFNKLSKKIMIGVLFLSVGNISAMEYGDKPQSNAAPTIGSCIYSFIKPSAKKADAIANTALYAAPMVAAPAVARSNKAMLIVAGGLLALWAGKKLYNWMYIKPHNGV